MTANTTTTYRGLIDDATRLLYNTSDTPRIDAEVLLQHVIQQPLAWLIAYGDSPANAAHIEAFYHLLEKRQHGQPIAYLTGSREFWSLTLKVTPDVLIPRPDTETLVEQALQVSPADKPLAVLDLGTGSGAIALAIAKERPQSTVLATDASVAALAIAEQNAIRNDLGNVTFLQSDWFQQLPAQRFNLIAANPPYVMRDDPHLKQGDLRFEPDLALVGGGDGLDDIRHICQQSGDYLVPGGYLIIEHGFDQTEQVHHCFQQAGFDAIQVFKDLNNLPRCSSGRWPA